MTGHAEIPPPLLGFFSSTPLAIAHRGGSKLRPENTLAAFDHGLTLGADAVECDVHLSKDDEPVVIHDPTLDRTTDRTGPIAALTAAELAAVDAGYRFGADQGFPFRGQGIGVPRLSDVLARTSRPVIVEIKGESVATAERAVDVVLAAGAEDRVVFAGFSHAVLSAVRARSRTLVTSASKVEVQSAVRRAMFLLGPSRPAFRVFQAPLCFGERRVLTSGLVRGMARKGVPTQAWIIDDEDTMRMLLNWGVNGLISDRPDIAVRVTREKGVHA